MIGDVPECTAAAFEEVVAALLRDPSIGDEELPGYVELRRAQFGLTWEEARVVLGVRGDSRA